MYAIKHNKPKIIEVQTKASYYSPDAFRARRHSSVDKRDVSTFEMSIHRMIVTSRSSFRVSESTHEKSSQRHGGTTLTQNHRTKCE
jgi:hypothetical protein